jgi:hypothetical protein
MTPLDQNRPVSAARDATMSCAAALMTLPLNIGVVE